MDGLPILEDSGLSYMSRVRQVNLEGEEMPVMHACGHDMHITSLVGTTKILMDNRDKWSGTIMLVGQPAEEIINGAKAMLEDGLYERFGVPDYALGFMFLPVYLVGPCRFGTASCTLAWKCPISNKRHWWPWCISAPGRLTQFMSLRN
ncbi:MAG: hypothetical protein Ct9H300mP22_4670 [Gammaproteobacteria bacterium]|nr:MAG: hypothetical protein Ct9H300mP22_4670 [Gammaproteobacteria bacterium]